MKIKATHISKIKCVMFKVDNTLVTPVLLAFLFFIIGSSMQAQFVHPGISHKTSDLDRIKYMVAAQVDPWYTSYQDMVLDSKSDFNYAVQGDLSFTELGRDNKVNYNAWNSDIRAAYYNAIRWYVEGDARHAEKAIEIFNSWVNLEAVTSNGTTALSGGIAHIMIEAAEIIKHTYNGWSSADRKKFEDMLVFPGYSNTAVPAEVSRTYGTFYWQAFQGDPIRHGNQGLSGWRTVMAMGIFLDNEIMYDRALRYIKGLPHRTDDLPYPAGPNTSNAITASNQYSDTYSITQGDTEEDYGYNEVMTHYIWENGQCQESSRDQQHTAFGIGLLTSMAEMAWNQGEDLYGFENDRLLLGLEYNMRYNVSALESYPDQTSPWEPTVASGEFIERMDRTGRWFSKAISPEGRGEFSGIRTVFEMPVAHYYGRGLKTENEVKWTTRARDKSIAISGYEQAGWTNDALGWGALTARRPIWCYGDPISGFEANGLPVYAMNVIDATPIEAENFDYDPIADGEGRTYHDLSADNSGGEYRTMDHVDIEAMPNGGYNVTSIESGEWLSYTVSVPETAVYGITIQYAALQAGGTIKISVAGEDKTTDVAVPFGAPYSTGGSDWKSYVVSDDIILNKGVQNLRLTFSGTSQAFKLDHFSLAQTGIVKEDQTIQFFTLPNKVIGHADFAPEAQASSGLDLSYTSSNTDVATLVDGKIHIVGAGTTIITASQNGNASFNAAPNVSQELTVVNAIADTVTLSVDADAYVNEGKSNDNYGTATSMVTKVAGRYIYLKFDLSTVPGPIVSAKLRMYQRTSFKDLRSVYDVADDSWTETGITWNNKPAYNHERAVITTNPSTWSEWDVSSYVAQEFNTDKVISFAVKDPVLSGIGVDFYSKEFDFGSVAPELVIECSSVPLSVSEVNASIETYPNPVQNDLHISLVSSSLDSDELRVGVYALTGQKIIEMKPTSQRVKLNLSELNSGIYVLKISDKSKHITKKIVKL
ncbi:DNRLRE domain-containing protein [Mariniflexile ostreae]|uniref:DNRLRE domain-containing protein n=1 Tax=Mariniflexile ostreae TaxID=1520892 RepID=A0ABV5FA75_9FLAO